MMHAGDEIGVLVLLPLDIAGQPHEYTFTFRVRAIDPAGLQERERDDLISKVGEEATLEKIVKVMGRQPDSRDERETSFGKRLRVTYDRERLSIDLLDGKLESVMIITE